MGMERCVALLQASEGVPACPAPELYIVASGTRAEREAARLAELLRDVLPGRGVLLNLGGGNFKAQFRRADRSGARLALIVGDQELARGVVAVKPLRREGGQSECPLALLGERIGQLLDREPGGSAQQTGSPGAAAQRAATQDVGRE
jgi:histidyl-tRNA synthetase